MNMRCLLPHLCSLGFKNAPPVFFFTQHPCRMIKA